ncbi:MAG: putative lipid II flippase FtsW [Egibacteraceae bacterium]
MSVQARARKGAGSARRTTWIQHTKRFRVAGEATAEFLLLGATTAALLLLGLVMTFSASFVQSAAQTGDAFGIFTKQLTWCGVGFMPMVVAAVVDYRRWRPFAAPLMLATLAASAAVLVPGLGVMVNGSRRWFDLGFANFQPSELLKLVLPIYLAHVCAVRWARLRRGDLGALLVPAVPAIVLAAGFVLLSPDVETAALIVVIGGLVLYVAGLPGRIVATGAGLAAALASAVIVTTPFRRARFAAWMNPTAYADTFGYQTVQGFIALGSGGWFGAGLGRGRGKWLYVPNAHTDFIFAIIGEELGLIGALFVLGLYATLAVSGIRTARRAPDPFGRLAAAGITAWLLLQATINVGSVVGLFPVTGVTLPLVSFGGSSLVFTMLGLGVLMSIARSSATPARARGTS